MSLKMSVNDNLTSKCNFSALKEFLKCINILINIAKKLSTCISLCLNRQTSCKIPSVNLYEDF